MTLLGIETSCDETSVAVVREGRVLANVVSSQVELHAEYGGVVPELAAREHLRNLLPLARTALKEAGVEIYELDAVAATQGPGLPNALLVGFKAAQAMAFVLRKPFLGIHHHEAHLYSPWITIDIPATRLKKGPTPLLTPALPMNVKSVGCSPSPQPSGFPSPPRVSFPTRDVRFAQRGPPGEGEDARPLVANFDSFEPNVSLIVSGGHTMLVHVQSELKHRVLGATIDDAAGECFDKTAKMIGLPYPGGPEIDRLAERGNPKAFDFPRPMLRDGGDDFSFSGLKTSVRYFLRDHAGVANNAQGLRDLCASVQAAIVEVLVTKTLRAAERMGVRCVTASGGVTCNRALREALAAGCRRAGLTLRLAERKLCTDNAAMIAILAERKLMNHAPETSLDAEIAPGWELA